MSRMLASQVAAAASRRQSGNGTPCSAKIASSRVNSAIPDQCHSTPTRGNEHQHSTTQCDGDDQTNSYSDRHANTHADTNSDTDDGADQYPDQTTD